MKFNITKILAAGALALAAVSCDDVLVDNVNPDAAHANTAERGLPVVVFYASQINYDHAEYYVYLSQCLTTMNKATKGTFPYKEGWEFLSTNRHPQWRRHFYDIGVNVNELIKNSQELGSPNYELIGRTIRLLSTQLTTDAWGDMPRSEAYQSNSPHYDTQASIYAWMLQEADELIAMYNDPAIVESEGNHNITAAMDRVYAGDLNKWKGLVQALKARILLRNIPNVDRSPAMCQKISQAAQDAIDTWRSGDLLYGSWFGNEPRYNYVQGGVGESACPWSAAQPVINSWESRANLLTTAVPSKFFIQDCMGVIEPGVEGKQGYWNIENGYGCDPRLMLLLKPNDGPSSPSSTSKQVMIRSSRTTSAQEPHTNRPTSPTCTAAPTQHPPVPTTPFSQWRNSTSSKLRLSTGWVTKWKHALSPRKQHSGTFSATSTAIWPTTTASIPPAATNPAVKKLPSATNASSWHSSRTKV